MAIEPEVADSKAMAEDRLLAQMRATPEERARLLAAAQPFDVEAWLRNAAPPSPEELADLEEFLLEREELRRRSLERDLERLTEKTE